MNRTVGFARGGWLCPPPHLPRNLKRFAFLFVDALAFTMAAAAFVAAGPVAAQEDLLKKYSCLACHTVDKKLVGPAYKDVAEKYRGQKDASDKLFEKVKRGGTGVWGQIPMPPNPTVPDNDLHAMIKYILSL